MSRSAFFPWEPPMPALLAFFSLARTIAEPVGLPQATAFKVLGIILIALSPLVTIFALFHNKDVVPGAMDDMAGVAVVAGLGKYLKDAREGGEFFPELSLIHISEPTRLGM